MAERVLSVRLRAIVDGYEAAMGRAATATEKVAKTGKSMESVGKKMTLGFSLPMVAAGGFALKSAISFESAFAGVQKTVSGTAEEMAVLEQGIIDMANSMPSTREEIAQVAAAAGQLGIETPNILEFSRTMLDLGNSTDVSAEQAAMSLAQLANITQMSQKDFDRLGSSVVALGNNFPTTESKIIDMSQRIASAGSQIGLTEADILGFSTALSAVGIEAEAGGTAISKVMIEIAQAVSAGGSELEKWAQIAGMSSGAFSSLFEQDASSAISEVIEGLGTLASTGGDLFGVMEEIGATDVRVGNALRSLAGSGDLLTRSIKLSNDAWGENDALTTEAGMRYATTESQLRIAGNRVTDVARQFGEVLVPAVHATLNVIEPVASGMAGLVQVMAVLPAPIKILGGTIMGLAIAAGPAIWGLGKLAILYGPLTSGAVAAAGDIRYLAQSIQSIAATRGISNLAAGMGVLKASLVGMIGPQLALVAGIAAIAGVAFLAHRASKQMAVTYMSSAEAADTLANSVGLLTRELRDNKAAADEVEVLSEDDFRKANEQIIEMLRNIDDLEGQQGMLLSIAFEMRAAGNTPEEVVEHIKRLAATAGIEVPVELNVTDVGQFTHQIEAAKQAAERAMADWDPASDVDLTRTMKEELSRLSESAANLWQNDETAAWAQLLGETTVITADSADATNHLVDEMLRLSGVSGLSTTNAKDLGTALDEMTSSGSNASEGQKEMLRTIREAATAMEGGLTPANFALAASQYTAGLSAAELGDRINGQREAADGAVGATGDLAAGQEKGAASAEDFASALDQVAANASFARMDFDAGAAAAQAFGEAMERSSRMSARLGAGLQGGAALKGLGEALTGEKQIAEIRERAAKETEKAASSIDRLGDAARRADPKLSALGIRLEALEAAGQAFRDSIDNSSMLDDQVSSALNLGDAYQNFEKTFRRLPDTLDITAIAMGKLRPREAEAVQNMLALGKAARDYLATLIEMGKSDAEVANEAARMRGEYEAMLRQMGLNEDQIRQYIEAMGLLPEQVTTAIRVSGMEAASVRLNAYIDLLDGRIPPEVATSIVAQIESGDVEGAAARLADFARSNPALLEVGVDQDSVDKTEEQIADVKAKLAELPAEIDPLKAMLGGYTDAQQAALEAVMQFGDGVASYLSQVAHDGNAEEIRDQAYQIRDAFLEQIGMGDQAGKSYGDMTAAAQSYLDLVGLSDWQIESSITLSGDADAMFRIQMYSQFLGEKIPPEVMTEVIALMDEGKLKEASDRLTWWRLSEENKTIQMKAAITTVETISNPIGMLEKAHGRDYNGNGIVGKASGGWIGGHGGPTSDANLIAASRGEFMIKASSASSIGPDALSFMNQTGMIPGTNLPFGTQLSGGMPSKISLDDASIARLAEHMGDAGVSFGDLNIYSPSERQTPRRVAEAVGVRVGRR